MLFASRSLRLFLLNWTSSYVLIFQLSRGFMKIIRSIANYHWGILISPLYNNSLSAAKPLKVFQSSAERWLYVDSFISSEISSFSILLNNTSRLAWPLGGFHKDLGLKAGVSLEFSDNSLQKCHLYRILQENSKYFLISGSFNNFWMGTKSSPFSKTLISLSVRTFLLKLKTDLEKKYLFTRSTSVTESLFLLFVQILVD